MDKQSFMKKQGKKIRAARALADMTQEELAKETGISRGVLSVYELGKFCTTTYRLYLIAKATGQPLSFFFPEEGKE